MTNEQAAVVIREARATAKLMIDPNLPPEEAREISLAMVQLVEAAGGTPDLRPMTLEEAIAHRGPVWAEGKGQPVFGGEDGWNVVSGTQQLDMGRCFLFSDGSAMECSRYGKALRFWPAKPTPEQSAAHPWPEEREE